MTHYYKSHRSHKDDKHSKKTDKSIISEININVDNHRNENKIIDKFNHTSNIEKITKKITDKLTEKHIDKIVDIIVDIITEKIITCMSESSCLTEQHNHKKFISCNSQTHSKPESPKKWHYCDEYGEE